MGCGASKDDLLSITSTEIVRHPSDLGLEYLELTPSNLVEFDDTFSQAEGTLNQLIELNNDVNDCIADVRSAYAVCTHKLQLDIQAGVPDTDVVLLDLFLAGKKTRPHPADIRALAEDNAELQAADTALQKACTQLQQRLLDLAAQGATLPSSSLAANSVLPRTAPPISQTQGGPQTGHRGRPNPPLPRSGSAPSRAARPPQGAGDKKDEDPTPLAPLLPPGYVQLSVAEDGHTLQAQPHIAEVTDFNQAVDRFSSCLGSKYAVRVTVMSCRAPGVPTIRARLMRPGQSQDLQLTGWYNALASALEPASLLDVASVDMEGAVDAIRRAEAALVYRTQWLSAKIKDLAAVQWQVLRRHKVTLSLIIADPELRSIIRKALVDINAALYTLVTCTANADGNGSLSGSVGEVVRQLCLVLRKRWENKGGLPLPVKKLLSVSAIMSFKDAGIFEFNVRVDTLPEAQLGVFPSCLTIPGQELLARIEMLTSTISNALRQLPNISSQIALLTEQAREFYDLVPEAAAQRGMTMMEAVKAGKAVGTNLDCLFSSERLFASFAANVRRVADDLACAQEEVNCVLQEQSDALQSRPEASQEHHHQPPALHA